MQAVIVQGACNQGENGELRYGNADESEQADDADAPEPRMRGNQQVIRSDEGGELADADGKELLLQNVECRPALLFVVGGPQLERSVDAECEQDGEGERTVCRNAEPEHAQQEHEPSHGE